MLPAIALPGSPSIPTVMTARGSITSNAARTHWEVSGLSSVSVPDTNPARKSLFKVSSSRQPNSSASTSGEGVPKPASARPAYRVRQCSPVRHRKCRRAAPGGPESGEGLVPPVASGLGGSSALPWVRRSVFPSVPVAAFPSVPEYLEVAVSPRRRWRKPASL